MSSLLPLSPHAASEGVAAGTHVIVDVREADETRRQRIAGSILAPLSTLKKEGLSLPAGKVPVFHCKSGMRTVANCDQLLAFVQGDDAYVLEGGIDAWVAAGLPVEGDANAPLEIMRQVQITAGILILIGVLLGLTVHTGFFGLSAFVGAGLTFAGATGWCGMAKLLSVMPWNRAASQPSAA